MKNIIGLLIIFLTMAGCKIDNFTAPSLTLSGKIVDSLTNKQVESGGVNAGAFVSLFQNNSIQPLIFNTYPDGTFMNSRVAAGSYTYKAEGPFKMLNNVPLNLDIKGNTEIEIKVIPNVRLTASLVSKSASSAIIKITYEKVPADQKLVQLAVVWSMATNPNLFTFSGGNVITKDVQSMNLISGEQEFTITGIQANTVYYIRAAARTNAAGNYYNYSSQFKL